MTEKADEEAVRRKGQPGKDVIMLGSANLAAAWAQN
jgi:hypothetical protein